MSSRFVMSSADLSCAGVRLAHRVRRCVLAKLSRLGDRYTGQTHPLYESSKFDVFYVTDVVTGFAADGHTLAGGACVTDAAKTRCRFAIGNVATRVEWIHELIAIR